MKAQNMYSLNIAYTHTQRKYIEIYFIVSKIYVPYIPNTLKYICIVVHIYLAF